MNEFKIKGESIKLSQFLKIILDFPSGGFSKIYLEENDVYVNNILEKRRNKKLFKGDIVKISEEIYSLI